MPDDRMTDVDVQRALEIWAAYQRQHDVSARKGQPVGIEPTSGRVWFGESGLDIKRQMEAEGIDKPFYCLRVGSECYLRKGARCESGSPVYNSGRRRAHV